MPFFCKYHLDYDGAQLSTAMMGRTHRLKYLIMFSSNLILYTKISLYVFFFFFTVYFGLTQQKLAIFWSVIYLEKDRSCHLRFFIKKSVLKIFFQNSQKTTYATIFLLIKLLASACNFLKKRL